jgi:hypothetical protein
MFVGENVSVLLLLISHYIYNEFLMKNILYGFVFLVKSDNI